jgi:lipopolysaccharide export system protein LptA
MKRRIWVIAACLSIGGLLQSRQAGAQIGQVQFKSPGSDSIKVVDILSDENYRFRQVDSVTALTTLVGHVKIRQEKTIIDCDSLIMNPHINIIECFGHVHINDNDSTHIYSDYMKYQVDVKKVHFDRNVRLTDGKGVLTTESLDYDMNTKIGTYDHGGKIVNKESVLTSDRGVYYEATKDVHFKDNVVLRDPQYDLSSDSLLYNTETQVSTFITETYILFKDSTHRSVRTSTGFYDLKNKKAEFGRQPDIRDGARRITGDSVRMDDSTGISTSIGHAVFIDTAQGTVLRAGYMVTDKKKGTFLATLRPLLILKQDKDQDSIYITADTLFSGRLVDAEAFQRRVVIEDSLHRIYVDSLQKASADSLHQRALLDTLHRNDTLQPVRPDGFVTKDRSDSLGAGVADSLQKEELDSLHRVQNAEVSDTIGKKLGDSTGKRLGDSAGRQAADTTGVGGKKDSTKAAHPLTERQKRKQEKEADRLAKAKIQAKIRAAKDSVEDIKIAAKARIRFVADSLKQKLIDDKARVRFVADSLRQIVRDSIRAKILADTARAQSLRRAADSATALSRGDSSYYKAALADSIRRARITNIEKTRLAVRQREADSVAAANAPTRDTTIRYILGYHHVRIYSDSLQAVSDSLYYSEKDSIFRLFYNPIAWSNGNYQVTGDTMFVYTKNKKASRLYVFENGLSINKVGRNFYNQLKGTTINSYFKDGEVDFVRAKGNAESIYYTQDDNKAYTGVNKAHADIIDMIFALKAPDSAGKVNGRELHRVVLRNDAEGSFIPMRKVDFDDMRLRGFKWQEDKRPKTKFELFVDPKKDKKYEEDEPVEPKSKPAPKPVDKKSVPQGVVAQAR